MMRTLCNASATQDAFSSEGRIAAEIAAAERLRTHRNG